jgi:hypothetical protein
MARNSLIMAASRMTHKRCAGRTKSCGQAADLCRLCGGIMSVKRTIIIPAILTLSMAGSILAGSAVSLATATAPTAVVAAAASSAHPDFLYQG